MAVSTESINSRKEYISVCRKVKWMVLLSLLFVSALLTTEAGFTYSHIRRYKSNDSFGSGSDKAAMPFLCFQALETNSAVVLTSFYSFDISSTSAYAGDKPFVYLTSERYLECLASNPTYNPKDALLKLAKNPGAYMEESYAGGEDDDGADIGWEFLEIDTSGSIKDALKNTNDHARIVLQNVGDCVWITGYTDCVYEELLKIVSSGTPYTENYNPNEDALDPRLKMGTTVNTRAGFALSGKIAVGGYISALTDGIMIFEEVKSLRGSEESASAALSTLGLIPCPAHGFPKLFANNSALYRVGIDMGLAESSKLKIEAFESARTLSLPPTSGKIEGRYIHRYMIPITFIDAEGVLRQREELVEQRVYKTLKTYKQGGEYGFSGMFLGCDKLTEANVTISSVSSPGEYQFANFFNGCSVLTNVTCALCISGVLETGCFEAMFSGCAELRNYPIQIFDPYITDFIDAFTNHIHRLGGYCCASMFAGCKSMEFPEDLSLNINLKYGDTPYPQPLIGEGANFYCMFLGCKKLKQIRLPAHIVPGYAYGRMFEGCTGLENLYCGLATNVFATSATDHWLAQASTNAIFHCQMEVAEGIETNYYGRGEGSVPEGWSVEGGYEGELSPYKEHPDHMFDQFGVIDGLGN